MSRASSIARPFTSGFPRVSGDEPGTPDAPKYEPRFSPRERG